MKHAISISIGSSKRNKRVEITLLGEKVILERIGTDGDMEKAAQLFKEYDGKVDAFGVGGTDLGLLVDQHWYPLYSVQPLFRFIRHTPYTDGTGLKNTLENRCAAVLEKEISDYLDRINRKALVTVAIDRWGMAMSFYQAGYDTIFGDFFFSLGIPIPLRKPSSLKVIAALLMPIVGRLPFEWVYPTGEKQEVRTPKWGNLYRWASVIAGDCHYIKRYMPPKLEGKIVVTNTTTPEDVQLYRESGVKYLLTTTPILDGRSFGTNMMEAALIAVSGKKRSLTLSELSALLDELHFSPQLQEL